MLVIVWCSGIFLNGYVGVGEVQASTTWAQSIGNEDTNSSFDTMGLWQILDMLLKLIYILLWPLLVIAGLALDNTLVYASVFHMDAPLWRFWNMMKNFANFALWFMVLFAIIKSILTNSGQWTLKDNKTPLGIIKTTLIAWVLIQASRFLVAATVDLSTVATYAVGGLPLSVLKNTDIGNKKILSVSSSVDLNKFDILSTEGENFRVWYSTNYKDGNEIKKVEFSPCRIEEWYIVGRQYKEVKFRNDNIFWSGQSACVAFGNQIVIYNEFPNVTDKDGSNYKRELDRILWVQNDRKPRESCGYVIKAWWRTSNLWTCEDGLTAIHDSYRNRFPEADDDILPITSVTPIHTNDNDIWLSGWTARFDSDNVIATTMSDLIKWSKWFVGPLVTIYSSLLNFAQLTDTSTTSIGETSWVFIIKTLVAVALFFPLLALAMVLIMRIGVLRLYIVASPFIVLKACFKDFIKMDKLDKYLDIKGVMWIIFAPVVTVAALSISLIFMTALVNGLTVSSSQEDIHKTFGIESIQPTKTGNDAIGIGGIVETEFTKLPWWDAMDWFSRLMVNFFAIGLMWMVVFAAIKANVIWEKVWGKVQDFGQNFFQTLPILPIGEGWGRVGVWSAGKVVWGTPERYIQAKENTQAAIAEKWINPEPPTIPTSIDTTWATSLINANTTAESIKSWLKEKWVEEANMGTVLTSSYATLGAAVLAIDDKAKQGEVIKAIGTAWAWEKWFETYTKDVAKNKLDALPAKDETELKKTFEKPDATNAPIIKSYFDAAGTDGVYERTIDKDIYVVKKWSDNTYVVEKKPTPAS